METRIWTLLTRQFAGEASREEIEELDQLLAEDPVIAKVAQDMKNAWHETSIDEMQNALSSFSKIDELIQKQTKVKPVEKPVSIPIVSFFKKYRITVAVAASFILFVASWFLIYHKTETSKQPESVTVVHEVSTPEKSIREISLPDGSLVRLNEGSQLKYDDGFNNTIREIWLTGEAFFDVAKNKNKPFIIHAGRVNVKVLGTEFNVRSYPGEKNVETSLVRGSVEITVNDDPEKKYLLSPNQKLTVPAAVGPSFNSQASGIHVSSEVKYSTLKHIGDMSSKDSVIAEISWVDGKLAFSESSFKDLAFQLERRYNVSFVFKDKSREGLVFTGVFYKQTLPEALHILSLAAPFKYHMQDSTVYIIK